MGDLTQHFSRYEVEGSHTARANRILNRMGDHHVISMVALLASLVEPARTKFAAIHGETPFDVTSGYRSEALNAAVDGAEDSQHMYAEALDFKPAGVDRMELWRVLLDMRRSGFPIDQAMVYENTGHVHVSHTLRRENRGEFRVKCSDAAAAKAKYGTRYPHWKDYDGPLKSA